MVSPGPRVLVLKATLDPPDQPVHWARPARGQQAQRESPVRPVRWVAWARLGQPAALDLPERQATPIPSGPRGMDSGNVGTWIGTDTDATPGRRTR